jgi:ferric-dicitrate binding protein FerR (iron transport regulator)
MDDRILKYFLGELDESERLQLLKLIGGDESLKNEFVEMQNLFALTQLSAHPEDDETAKESFRIFTRRLQAKQRKLFLIKIGKIAAVVLALIVSTVFATLYFAENSTRNTAFNTLYVPAGQRAQITLQDGTTVWLNAKSTLRYPSRFAGKERKVTLTGEAFFDVAKNSRKPFIVESQDIRLKVLGTQFNVYNYPDVGYSRIALIEGSVKISWNANESDHVMLKPSQELVLQGGEALISEITNPNYFLWKDGIYSFDNESLLEIIQKLQLYYDVTIKVEDPEIFNVRYTGKFRQSDGIDEILRIIRKIHRFDIKKDPDNHIITLSK